MIEKFRDFWDYALEYISDKYFSPKLVYDNFDLTNAMMPLTLIIISIFIGANLASLSAIYNKRLLGGFVRALINANCSSRETACGFLEIDFCKNPLKRAAIGSALRPGGVLRKIVTVTDSGSKQDLPAAPGYVSLIKWLIFRKKDRAKLMAGSSFYINEDNRIKAEIRYGHAGTSIRTFFIMLVLSVFAVLFLIYIIPELLTMVDNFIGSLSPQPNYSAPGTYGAVTLPVDA